MQARRAASSGGAPSQLAAGYGGRDDDDGTLDRSASLLDARGLQSLLASVGTPSELESLAIAHNPLRCELAAVGKRPTVGDRVVLLESMEMRVLVEDDGSEDTPYLDDCGDWLAEEDVRMAQPAQLEKWDAACEHLAAEVKLERLDLSGCGIDAEAAEVLADRLSGGGAPSLTWADLRRNELGSGGARLAAMFRARPRLRTLLGASERTTTIELRDMRLDWGTGLVLAAELSAGRAVSSAMALLLRGNTSLLVDSAASSAAQQAWSILSATIVSSALVELELDNIGLDDAAATALCRAATHFALNELSLADNAALGHSGAEALARMVFASPQLRHVRFGRQAGVRVPVHTERMRLLDVSAQGLGPEDCHLLSAVVASNTGLVTLNLAGNPITGGEMGWDEKTQEYCVCLPGSCEAGVRALARAMAESRIKIVELDNCGLMSQCCACLAAYMRGSAHLESLSLFQNSITGAGVTELVEAAKANPSICSIAGLTSSSEHAVNWAHRRLGIVGCRLVSAELNLNRHASYVTHLSLAGNFIGAPSVSAAPGTVSVDVIRGAFARMKHAWGEVISDPEDGEVTLKWMADGTESQWISVGDLSPVVSSRSELVEDYSHVQDLGEAIRNSSLIDVDLSYCFLNAGSVTALVSGIGWVDCQVSTTCRLQRLSLLGNSIPIDVLTDLKTAAGDTVRIDFDSIGMLPSDRAASLFSADPAAPSGPQRAKEATSEPETEPQPTTGEPSAAEFCGERTGLSLAGLLHCIERFGITDDTTTTSDVCHAYIKPTTVPSGWVDEAELLQFDEAGNDISARRWYKHTYRRCDSDTKQSEAPSGTQSMCELLATDPSTASFVGPPTHFLSHAWLYKILNVVAALKLFVESQPQGNPEIFFWFDCFSLDEHATQSLSQEWWSTTFKEAIRIMGHTVMMLSPWNAPQPLTRSWCLWELYCTVETGSNFSVCLGPAEQAAFHAALLENLNVLLESFACIDVRNARAGNPADQANILAAVEQSAGGVAGLNELAIEHLRRWVVGQARQKVRAELQNGRLSTKALDAAHSVAVVLHQVGENVDALHLAKLVVRERAGFHGEHHPTTLSSKLLLGNIMRDNGRYSEARGLYDTVVAERTQLLGEVHPETLKAKGSLANLLDDQGETASALALFEAVLASSTEQLGRTHSFTLMTQQNCATVLHSLGKIEAAQRAYEQAIKGYEELYGPRHAHTLTASMNLANLLDDTGCTNEAKELYARVIEGNKTQFGTHHGSTLTAQMALANLLRQNGETQSARELCDIVVERCSAVYGTTHTLSLSAVTLRGSILEDLGLYQECLAVREDILQHYQHLLGSKHAFVRDSEMNLAAVLMWMPGRLHDAKERTQRVVERCIDELGAAHTSTLHAQNNLALILHLAGDHASAQELYRQIYATYTERFGAKHRFTLNALLGLAITMDAAATQQGSEDQANAQAEEVQVLLTAVVKGYEAKGNPDEMTMPLVEAAVYLAEHQVEQGCINDHLLAKLDKLIATALCSVGALHRISAYATSARGLLLHRRGYMAEAEAQMRDALSRQQRIHGEGFFYTRKTQHRLDELVATGVASS